MKVGVVIARFQVASLHAGQKHILNHALNSNDTVVVMLGVAAGMPTKQNPLSYETRRDMVREEYSKLTVVPLPDTKFDTLWSARVDEVIAAVTQPHDTVELYGSRDSFIDHYIGRYRTIKVAPIQSPSGTELRAKIGRGIHDDVSFREGLICAQMMRRPAIYPAVDIAIRRDNGDILLGQKKQDDGKLRFIGGFVDAEDASLWAAARREAYEETSGMEIDDVTYVGSARIDDWRYRGTDDTVMSTLFCARYVSGVTKAGDDLDGLVWVPRAEILYRLAAEHIGLGNMLIQYLGGIEK